MEGMYAMWNAYKFSRIMKKVTTLPKQICTGTHTTPEVRVYNIADTTFCNIETNVVYFRFKNCADRYVNQEMPRNVSTEHVLTISNVEMAKYCMLRSK